MTRLWEGESGLSQLSMLLKRTNSRPERFIGWLIAFIISAIIIAATAAVATTALVKSLQAAHAVANVLKNVTAEMNTQVQIDQEY